jgi:tyrosine-protein kinase Etk/Wzc
MASTSGFRLLDYIEFVVRSKQLFLIVFLSSLVTAYVGIYLFVDDRFEATATIIPRQDETSSLASSMLRGIKGIPLSLGGGSTPNDQIDLYKTIIYSRTMMENVIGKFNLISAYAIDTTDIGYMEKATKKLKEDIQTKETEESAFLVSVRAKTRQMSADITNYVVHALNERIVELQVSRSRDNRIFLENRVQELSNEIKIAEDSLRVYQERTGMLDIKAQLEGILTTHATLETEFAGKQLQLSILQKMLNGDAPEVKQLKIQVQEYERKLRDLRTEGDPGSPLLPLKSIPSISVGFVNRFREVEIDNLLLEFVMPLYEQAKFEEKKDYPILQVIDYAVPPAKRSYPPRVLLALLGACSVSLLVFIIVMMRERVLKVTNPRLLALMNELRQWDWKLRRPVR